MARLGRILGGTRMFVLLGVVASLSLSVALFLLLAVRTVAAFVEVVSLVFSAGEIEKAVKTLALDAIEIADLTLLASALIIVGLGLFELYIGPAPMPERLMVRSLDDLKARLVNVVVVVLAVSFLGQAVTWNGTQNLLPLGIAIGAVIVALSAFTAVSFAQHAARESKVTGGGEAGDAGEDGAARDADLDMSIGRPRRGKG